ncbi:MAG: hypothetical protein Rhirs2KO_12630 [Rhizobiaceae bacterium]
MSRPLVITVDGFFGPDRCLVDRELLRSIEEQAGAVVIDGSGRPNHAAYEQVIRQGLDSTGLLLFIRAQWQGPAMCWATREVMWRDEVHILTPALVLRLTKEACA